MVTRTTKENKDEKRDKHLEREEKGHFQKKARENLTDKVILSQDLKSPRWYLGQQFQGGQTANSSLKGCPRDHPGGRCDWSSV